jgi:hypothetical protein
MSEQIIPSKYENAIRHAIATFNKPLLNRLELELIRIFEIKPFDKLGHDYKNLSPIGIAEVNSRLLISWGKDACENCRECDGTGIVEAVGNTKTFEFSCPVCDGDGTITDGICLDEIITDIEGKSVDFDGSDTHFETFEINCPLAKYNDEQRKLKASKVAA